MVWKMVSAAVFAVSFGAAGANAQSAGDLRGPRELPPSSFTGQQYVDSRGCVFLRAGLAGRTNWVPRVTRDRKQLCGYPPTFSKQVIDVVEDDPRPAPQPSAPAAAGRRPIDTVATTTTAPRIRETPPKGAARVPASSYAAPPVVMAPPTVKRVVKAAPPAAAPAPKRVVRSSKPRPANGCYAEAPVRETFELRGGGTITLCTSGNGSLTDARPPRLEGGAGAVSPSGYVEGRAGTGAPQVTTSSQNVPVVPKGYRLAWKDDRLNPNRGKGTAQGWAAQDRIWTREVPMRTVEEATRNGKRVVILRRVSVSTKSSPVDGGESRPARTAAPAGKTYVQVGTYGQPENASGAAARLKALGLPVARAKISSGGKGLQIVMAGPFTSAGQAQAALAAARKAGFGDAFIR